MNNGLTLGMDEFNSLPQKEKFSCLYENQLKQIQILEEFKKTVKGYKTRQIIHSIFIGASLGGLGILFKMALHI